MTATNAEIPAKMGYLKERLIKYIISLVFVSLWVLVLGLYFTRGQEFMGSSQRRIYQFVIVVNLMTLTVLLLSGAVEVWSKKSKTYWRCSSVMGETCCVVFVIVFQTVAAITLSAGTPSFKCTVQSACAMNVFFTLASWVLPCIYFVHLLEFVVRSRRIATLNPMLWSTVVWLVEWDTPEHYRNSQDLRQTAANTYHKDLDALERGAFKNAEESKIKRIGSDNEKSRREPKKLVLPGLSRIPPVPSPLPAPIPPRYSIVFTEKETRRERRAGHNCSRHNSHSRRQARGPQPIPVCDKNGEGVIIFVPEHIQYTVPTLQAAPRPKAKKRPPPVPPKSWYHR